ncbi:DsrE family protein [Chryseobacterium sp. c4a]|uniref:DsrE family protein n=1 Tax=Chryseobacterium sp. c4a TaxID=1573582 RepID=UPI001358A596|nr:DsrE family protein [Chryseobacterium sp. c4a]
MNHLQKQIKENGIKALILSMVFLSLNINAQKISMEDFQIAKATHKSYQAMYIINESDKNKMDAVLRNIGNALEDPRLKNKLKIVLLAFGGGVEIFKKNNTYESQLLSLKDKGVVFLQCENTLREKQIAKDELYKFIHYTPSGNGEIILRQYEGWAIVKP